MKKPYARIDFTNCGYDYDYTICEWCDVRFQIEAAESDFTDVDEPGYKLWQKNDHLPEIKISLVMLTDKQFDKFMKQLEKSA